MIYLCIYSKSPDNSIYSQTTYIQVDYSIVLFKETWISIMYSLFISSVASHKLLNLPDAEFFVLITDSKLLLDHIKTSNNRSFSPKID